MSLPLPTTLKNTFHPLFQFAWGGVLLLVIVFPTDVLAGNMLEKAIELVNNDRMDEGLVPLTRNPLLDRAAEAKADDMIKNDYFAHTSPLGQNPWYWLKQVGYEYKAAGENLAINYDDAKEEHRAWMKGETHRANILNSHFQEIGMATRHGRINGEDATVTVQLFGTPRTTVVAKKSTELTKAVPKQAVQGAETEMSAVAIEAKSIPMVALPTPTALTTFLVNPTLFEKIMYSHFIVDRVWLIWIELFMTLIFFSLALALPILFIGIMNMKLRASWHAREHALRHIPINMSLATQTGVPIHLIHPRKRHMV